MKEYNELAEKRCFLTKHNKSAPDPLWFCSRSQSTTEVGTTYIIGVMIDLQLTDRQKAAVRQVLEESTTVMWRYPELRSGVFKSAVQRFLRMIWVLFRESCKWAVNDAVRKSILGSNLFYIIRQYLTMTQNIEK